MNTAYFIFSIVNTFEQHPPGEIVYGYAGIIYAIIMAVAAGYQAYSQSEAQKTQADIAEKTAENEANRLEFESEREANKAEQEKLNRIAAEKTERDAHKRRRAIMESSYAKSGVMIDGTPSEFLVEQETVDEINVQRNNQASEAKRMGFSVNADLLNSEANWTKSLGDSQASAYRAGAQRTLIGGALNMAASAAGGMAGGGGERASVGSNNSFIGPKQMPTSNNYDVSSLTNIDSFPSWVN